MDRKKEVIIVGGGFGGISVAKGIRNSGYNITIIDRKNHHLFQPLLYQVATAALSPGDIAMPIRAIFSKSDNIRTILADIKSIDPEGNRLSFTSGETMEFDYLVLAPGAEYNYFGNDQWAKSAPGLKTLDNALTIRETVLVSLEKAEQLVDRKEREPYLTYAIIGAGPTGVEMAGAIAEIAKRNMMRDFRNISPDETRVYLIEAGPKVLNGYPDELSKKALLDLEGMGVNVLLNSPVTDIGKDGVQLESDFIKTPNIIWAAGVKASPLLQTLNCEYDKMGRAKVNPDLTLPGTDNIFVIGDAAYLEGRDGSPLPALAPVALQQGAYIAMLLKNKEKNSDTKPFHYIDKGTMATIGRAKAVVDIKGFKISGLVAWLIWSVIHIFFLIGYRNRFRVFAEWIWHYLSFKRGVRLITDRFKEPNSTTKER
jgi:NADH:ubiquinone reductase (H+-translocating)